jgi:DNA polymerase-3 subunit alpha
MGISILAPTVNESFGSFSVEGQNLRFGLAAIKNVGALFADKIINERRRKRFSSLEDFISRCAQFGSIKTFESLITAGALDEFGIPRSQMLLGLSKALETVTKDRSRNAEGQMSLFGNGTAVEESVFEYPRSNVPELVKSELLRGEKEMTGLYFSGHPLDGYRDVGERIGAISAEQIKEGLENGTLKKNSLIKFIGLVTKKRSKVTKKNDIMAFVTAEDESGEAELIGFPALYSWSGALISENKVLVFCGNPEISETFGEEGAEHITVLLRSVQMPDEALKNEQSRPISNRSSNNYKPREETKNSGASEPKTDSVSSAQSLYIKVTDANSSAFGDALELASRTGGESRILVYFEAEKRLTAAKGRSAHITDRLLAQLKELMGDGNIAVK